MSTPHDEGIRPVPDSNDPLPSTEHDPDKLPPPQDLSQPLDNAGAEDSGLTRPSTFKDSSESDWARWFHLGELARSRTDAP